MGNFISFLTSTAVLIAGIIFLKFSDRIAKALDASDAVFWKSLNLFKQTSQKPIISTKILIFIAGLVFAISGISSLFTFLITIFHKKG